MSVKVTVKVPFEYKNAMTSRGQIVAIQLRTELENLVKTGKVVVGVHKLEDETATEEGKTDQQKGKELVEEYADHVSLSFSGIWARLQEFLPKNTTLSNLETINKALVELGKQMCVRWPPVIADGSPGDNGSDADAKLVIAFAVKHEIEELDANELIADVREEHGDEITVAQAIAFLEQRAEEAAANPDPVQNMDTVVTIESDGEGEGEVLTSEGENDPETAPAPQQNADVTAEVVYVEGNKVKVLDETSKYADMKGEVVTIESDGDVRVKLKGDTASYRKFTPDQIALVAE